jgi:hypothetical protein
MKKFPLFMLLWGLLCLLFGCGDSSGYYKKSGRWFYDGVPLNREADPAGLQVLGDFFARDSRIGYYRGSEIEVAGQASDGPSFEAMGRFYAKDRFRVYYCDTERDSKEYWSIRRNRIRVLTGADPASFRLLDDGYTARDRQQLFHNGVVRAVKDLDSYRLLEHSFAADRLSAYYRWTAIAGSDGASFEVLDSYYARDKARIYYVSGFDIGGSIKGAQRENFKMLEDGYATDGSRAYYRGAVIASRNAGSLQAFGQMGYARTLDQVFHNGKPMRDADAASFAVTPGFDPDFDASDRSGRFRNGERLPTTR